MRQKVATILLVILIAACANIEKSTNTDQAVGQIMIVGVGDVVLRVNKQRNLENAFGKSDIFGRKTNEGFSEIRFAGVEKSGEIILYRRDVHIISNETTMSRTPLSMTSGSTNTNVSGSYYGNQNYGNVNANSITNQSSTTLMPATDFHVVIPAETIPIRLQPGETKIPMEGYLIEIIKATSSSIEYKISSF